MNDISDVAYQVARKEIFWYSKEALLKYTPMTFFINLKDGGLVKAIEKDVKLTLDHFERFLWEEFANS